MIYVVFAILGFLSGMVSIYFALESRRKGIESQKRHLDEREAQLRGARSDFERQAAQWTAEQNARLQAVQSQFQTQCAQWTAEQQSRWDSAQTELQIETERVFAARAEIEGKVISYQNLADENVILKRDLRNLDVRGRKLQLDQEVQRQAFESQRTKVDELGSRYLKENVKWIGTSLTANNFVSCK